jgi:hypothetical protein
MIHNTKIAVIIRSDLLGWQKVNVTAFLCSGVAAANPQVIGKNYKDGSGTEYMAMLGQPVFVYGADKDGLLRALDRALSRNVKVAVYTEEMFKTDNDVDNRAVVEAVKHEDLNLVGIAFYADSKIVDKIKSDLKFLQ